MYLKNSLMQKINVNLTDPQKAKYEHILKFYVEKNKWFHNLHLEKTFKSFR